MRRTSHESRASFGPGRVGARCGLVLAGFVWLGLIAQAKAAGDIVTVYNGGVVSNSRDMIVAGDSRVVSGRSVVVTKTFDMAAPGGRTAAGASMRWAVGESMIVRNGLAFARPMFGPIGAGLAIAALLHDMRLKPTQDGPFQKDDGANPPTTTTSGSGFSAPQAPLFLGGYVRKSKNFGFTQLDACNSYRKEYTDQGAAVRNITDVPGSCRFEYQYPVGAAWNGTGNIPLVVDNGSVTTTGVCPPVVDFNDPAYSYPAGPPQADGMCPTGVYSRGMTPDEAADWAANHHHAENVDLGKMWDEVLGRASGPAGPGGVPTTPSMNPDVTPPPPLAGPKVTTTKPDGTVTETATGWDFTRRPDAGKTTGTDVVVTPKTTTTEKNAAGTVTSTTTTTSSGPTTNPNDPCAADPGRLECIGLGAPPTDPVPKLTKSISFEAQDMGMGVGACPQPIPIHAGKSLSFEPACDVAVKIQPIVLAGAVFTGMMMVVFALRS